MNYVLNNERYKGDALLQKQITTQTLPFKKQRNHGEQPIFKTWPTLTAYDSDLTDQAVSEIQLKGNGTISLVLINGQRIGKEKSA